jgi:hypothetical protein
MFKDVTLFDSYSQKKNEKQKTKKQISFIFEK